MQKVTLFAVLALAAASSWAFYPKSPAAGTQQLFLISDITLAPEQQYNAALTTIEPDGSFHTEELSDIFYANATKEGVAATISSKNEGLSYVYRRSRYARNMLLQKELLKIKELTAQGWTLIDTVPDKSGVRYIFQKASL